MTNCLEHVHSMYTYTWLEKFEFELSFYLFFITKTEKINLKIHLGRSRIALETHTVRPAREGCHQLCNVVSLGALRYNGAQRCFGNFCHTTPVYALFPANHAACRSENFGLWYLVRAIAQGNSRARQRNC